MQIFHKSLFCLHAQDKIINFDFHERSMISPIAEKMKGVLFHPAETFAETIRNDTLKDTLIYLLILVAIFTVLVGILLLVGVSAYAGLLTGLSLIHI